MAHSLGALISGDLLNLLQHQKNDRELQPLGYGPEEKTKIPIRLFTMGNPLRQLLNRFFPNLSDWVQQSPDNGTAQLGPPLRKPPESLVGPTGSTLLPILQIWASRNGLMRTEAGIRMAAMKMDNILKQSRRSMMGLVLALSSVLAQERIRIIGTILRRTLRSR